MGVLYVTSLIVTTLVWGYIFYKKDYHPQPLKVILQSFGVGLFAMLPVFGYQYAYLNLLPGLAEYQIFQPLLGSALMTGVLVFGLNLALLSLLLLALSGVLTLVLTRFNHNTLVNFKNALKQEPLGFGVVSFLIGLVIYLEAMAESWFGIQVIGTALGTILFLAIIEEYIKHLVVRLTDDKKLKDIDDAITLSIMVGLAFAFVETLFYSLQAGDTGLILYRIIVSTPVHIVASGIFGYYYGLAHFAKPIVAAEEGKDETLYKGKWFHKLLTLKKSTLYSEEKIVEGILVATGFHAVLNLLFELGYGFLGVPLIVGGITLLFHLYKLSQLETKLILKKVPQLFKRA